MSNQILPYNNVIPVKDLVKDIHNKVSVGIIDASTLVFNVKKAEKLCKALLDGIEGKALKAKGESGLRDYQDEFGTLPDKVSKLQSYSTKKFDYSEVNHPELRSLLEIKTFVDERLKVLQKELEDASVEHHKASDPLNANKFKVASSNRTKKLILVNEYKFEVIENGEEFIEVTLPKMETLYLSRFMLK